MINTETQIQKAFIKLLDKHDFNEIDVNMICKTVNIKRQTFYYHFKNVYDVIYSIYCYQKVGNLFDNNIASIVNSVFSFLYKDQEFNILVAKSNASEVLKEFLNSYINVALNRLLDKYNLRISDKKDISRFFSRAIAEQCLYYFMQEEYSIKEGCSKISYLFNEDILRVVIRKYQNNIE